LRPIKSLGKSIVCDKLEWQVTQLRKRHPITVIAVAGSVGKTSTKAAIAQVLGTSKKVLYQKGNYNDRATVPLVFFNEPLPALWNAFAWFKLFRRNQKQLRAKSYPYDIVVLELGTDGPGNIKQFAYTKPDIAVVTALTAEHMEYFKTLDAVASEELTITSFSKTTLLNLDDINLKYISGLPAVTYSLEDSLATYFASAQTTPNLQGQSVEIHVGDNQLQVHSILLGQPGAKVVLAAVAVAKMLGLPDDDIISGVAALFAFPGRLQRLAGVQGSVLLDDTYNASPAASMAALDVLQAAEATQRIAILGSMNEMGAESELAHMAVGAYCDPTKLQYVVTIGADANKWLAPAARDRGCTVQECDSPYQAGVFVASKLQNGAIVLAKGSQNGVFAEESLKPLLANPADQAKLVRQSAYWLGVKRKQFTDSSY
jgi:UDP-N-acetylmuramoyl-tripeptide--D-alanyl-D-alanine ligase